MKTKELIIGTIEELANYIEKTYIIPYKIIKLGCVTDKEHDEGSTEWELKTKNGILKQLISIKDSTKIAMGVVFVFNAKIENENENNNPQINIILEGIYVKIVDNNITGNITELL